MIWKRGGLSKGNYSQRRDYVNLMDTDPYSLPGIPRQGDELNLLSYSDDDTLLEENSFGAYWIALWPCYEKLGINWRRHGVHYQRMLEKTGFGDVNIYTFKVPIGILLTPSRGLGSEQDEKVSLSPKSILLDDDTDRCDDHRLGSIFAEVASTEGEAYGLGMLTSLGGYSVDEATELVKKSIAGLRDPKVHAYYFEYYITARKPE
ncbi:hypothetical protein EX30DRAFT_346125 [Ascodesmis nigricans]|uniref:Uncharacterized protein n=1 Tax=Ascodesmis nigricans TaxID=341454 RepID=A0A4V3SJX0_9PEZI|nr:hypothetical protein EX30DRAFT_346125 [Ascodesmis nigricans]